MLHFVRASMMLLLLLLMTGCWSKEELNDRAFVTVIYADAVEGGQVELGLGFILPNRMTSGQVSGLNQQGEKAYTLINRRGANLMEAFQKIQKDLPRRITWGSTRIVILGEKFARQGIDSLLEFFFRVPNLRIVANVFQVDGMASDVASLNTVFERFPAEILRELSHMQMTLDVTIKDLLYAQASAQGAALIPKLYKTTKKMVSEGEKPGTWVGTAGAAVMKRGRLIGAIKEEEMMGAMWATKPPRQAYLSVQSPADARTVTISLYDMRQNLRVRRQEGQYIFDLHLKMNGEVIMSESSLDMTVPGSLEELEQSAEERVRTIVNRMMDRSRKLEADFLHLGEYIRWKWPVDWARLRPRWESEYAGRTTYRVHAEVRLRRLGGEQRVAPPPEESAVEEER